MSPTSLHGMVFTIKSIFVFYQNIKHIYSLQIIINWVDKIT